MSQDVRPVRTIIPHLDIAPPDAQPGLHASTVAHFSSIPWTASLINRPDIITAIPQCRSPASDVEDQLFGNTLARDSAIPHMLYLIELPGGQDALRDPSMPVRRVSTLYQLGDKITGGPAVLHGGMTMAMVDETMGSITEVNTALGKSGAAFNGFSVTGTLDIRFQRPIYTPCTVIATATLEEIKGRRVKVRCEVAGEDGQALATCSSVWVATSAPKM